MAAANKDDPLSFPTPPSYSSSPVDPSAPVASSSQFSSAPGSFQSEGILGDAGGSCGSDADFGFLRPDFRQCPLVGTVPIYHRHVFLCYKNPQVWPAHIEAAEFDRLPRLLSVALMSWKGAMTKQTRLTICEGHDGTETSNGDVLIFPDMIRYRRLTHFDVDTFVEEVLVKDGEWLPGTPETLKGSYVFVCSHGSRDRRCGVCGPPLVARFKEEIESHGLHGKVSVSPCSHVGGHRYAGNVIIFGSKIDGDVTGHWYGYVTPDDVPLLLEQHIGKGEIIDLLWRGQMGLTEDEQKKSQELRLHLVSENKNEATQTQENETDFHVEPTGACPSFQVNGATSSGCRNTSLPERIDNNPNTSEREMTVLVLMDGKNPNRKLSRTNSGIVGAISKTWFDNWEREDTYAALSVLFAVVSVGVAYKLYRQLG